MTTTQTREQAEKLSRTDIARIYRDCYGTTRFSESDYLFAKAVERTARSDIEAKVAELEDEITLAKNVSIVSKRRGELIDSLTEKLAASQALEKGLRDVLEKIAELVLCGKKDHLPGRCDSASKLAIKALSTHTDDTALREYCAAEVEPYKADAERYRWLRLALSDRSMHGRSHHFCSISNGHPEELDQSIDVALRDSSDKIRKGELNV